MTNAPRWYIVLHRSGRPREENHMDRLARTRNTGRSHSLDGRSRLGGVRDPGPASVNKSKNMDKWWEGTRAEPDYYGMYRVEDTDVIVAGRPDFRGLSADYCRGIDGWLSVSDRFIEFPEGARHQWFPWIENGPPKPEILYGSLMTLTHWIDRLRLRRVYCSCDAGTHRSPSIFGAYLAGFHRDVQDEIARNVKLGPPGRPRWSCPVEYWTKYEQNHPRLASYVRTIAVNNTPCCDQGKYWGYQSAETLWEMTLPGPPPDDAA